ncbi:MAG TPA: type I 3-dehydroquinate dehydratase [Methanothrix sp.]|nr:type I 3-dehydroquinate dehydratase [Methanothrix sp.]HPJ84389.1 type I 3-dehydroquinate dehydratase [Methanothrix sp.]HPR67391.1 type I 3-dehydroquinate dehydratase [Methanothrix sp.]
MNEKKSGKRKLTLKCLKIDAPAVVAVLSGEGAAKDASIAEGLGADLVEVRLDLLPGDPLRIIREVRDATPLPIIVTNRLTSEGGAFGGGEDERIEILAEASTWADLVDVELLAGGRDRLVEMVDLPVIISYHDFEGVPPLDVLRSMLEEIFEAGADIAKLALTPPALEDCLDLLKLPLEAEGPISLMGMGDVGKHLRAIAPIYGSVLTYGYIGNSTAPGQIPVKALREVIDLLIGESR